MDEQTLAEQFAKTGDIIDLCRDEIWVRESARIEAECGGRIEAGPAMKAYAQAKYDDSLNSVRKELQQQMRVQSILFVELRQWMEEWDIGIAFSQTYTEARELVRAHLKQPTPELTEWIEAVLVEEDAQTSGLSNKPVQAKTREKLIQMMTEKDWETLAKAAADAAASIVTSSIIKVSQEKPRSTVAA